MIEWIINKRQLYEDILYKLEMESLCISETMLTSFLNEHRINDYEFYKLIQRSSFIKKICNYKSNYSSIISNSYNNNVNLYLTHWFYLYKGKFHPQMIRALLNIIDGKENSKILDPFCGSATTALESQLLNIDFIGIDISPVCKLIGDVKTKSVYYVKEIINAKDAIIKFVRESVKSNGNMYYDYIDDTISEAEVRKFYYLARLITLNVMKKLNKNYSDLYEYYLNSMMNSIVSYKNIVESLNLLLGDVKLFEDDSRMMKISDNSIDGIITSPPYFNAVNYLKNDEVFYMEQNIDLTQIESNFIGIRNISNNQFQAYFSDLEQVYSEMYRVLKNNSYAVIIIGNNYFNNMRVNNVKTSIDLMRNIGFKLIRNIPKNIIGKKNKLLKENILFFIK